MKWVQPDHKYSHVRPEDLQLYASKASFLQKWREWTIKTSVICSHISLIAKSIMPSRNLFLWSWKFRKKMVLELKTCIEGVPQAEVRLAPAEVGFTRRCLPSSCRLQQGQNGCRSRIDPVIRIPPETTKKNYLCCTNEYFQHSRNNSDGNDMQHW